MLIVPDIFPNPSRKSYLYLLNGCIILYNHAFVHSLVCAVIDLNKDSAKTIWYIKIVKLCIDDFDYLQCTFDVSYFILYILVKGFLMKYLMKVYSIVC